MKWRLKRLETIVDIVGAVALALLVAQGLEIRFQLHGLFGGSAGVMIGLTLGYMLLNAELLRQKAEESRQVSRRLRVWVSALVFQAVLSTIPHIAASIGACIALAAILIWMELKRLQAKGSEEHLLYAFLPLPIATLASGWMIYALPNLFGFGAAMIFMTAGWGWGRHLVSVHAHGVPSDQKTDEPPSKRQRALEYKPGDNSAMTA